MERGSQELFFAAAALFTVQSPEDIQDNSAVKKHGLLRISTFRSCSPGMSSPRTNKELQSSDAEKCFQIAERRGVGLFL